MYHIPHSRSIKMYKDEEGVSLFDSIESKWERNK